MFHHRTFALLAALLGVVLLLNGCIANSSATSASDIVVTTSISPLADLIKQVGGEKIKVINLVPAGTDPHEYEPKPSDVREVARSSIFFANGVGEELYLNKLIQNAGNSKLRTVVLSDGLPVLEKNDSSLGNPHLWLDVQNAEYYVTKIQDELSQISPANKAYFAENANAYKKKLQDLDSWIQAQIKTIPLENRKMIVFHNAWSYYAKRYGLIILKPVLTGRETEPSAKDYAELLGLIHQNRVRAVFGEAGFNPKLVEQLASDSGVKYVGNLYDDTLGESPDTNSYLAIMKANTISIVSALRN